jgi:phosphoglycolate phosphatase-like HAD superfamily hydrolase
MYIGRFKYIFFDFDGVIKESVNVKAEVFTELFKSYGQAISKKVYDHHMMNGGLSRFEKIAMYLSWVNENNDDSCVEEVCNKFSHKVKEKVINSPWVPGIETFLHKNRYKQSFIILSATPQKELEEICQSLNLTNIFSRIIGWPNPKSEAISKVMNDHKILPEHCLMIGDYISDLEAAKKNKISFLLRRHEFNSRVEIDDSVKVIENFIF